jgi:PAS domain S-box-containing protein
LAEPIDAVTGKADEGGAAPRNFLRRDAPLISMSSSSGAYASAHRLTGFMSLSALGISLLVLALWSVLPAFSFRLMQVHWLVMSPQSAAAYCLLATALLFYDSHPLSARGRWVLVAAGTLLCTFLLARLLLPGAGDGENLSSAAALFGLGLSIAAVPAARRQRSRISYALGGLVLAVIVSFLFFLICYCHGVRSLLEGGIPCPHLLSVLCTVLLAAAVLGALGPEHFPMRLFVGSSVRSALLRKSLPVTIAVILVFVCVRGSMPDFLSPPFAAFLTLMMSSAFVVYLVLRSSSVVATQLEKALQESEQNYTHLVRGLKDYAVFLLDVKGNVLVWNLGAERITGFTATEVLGKKVTRLFPSREDGLEMGNALERVRDLGAFQVDGWAVRKDAHPFWAETALSGLVDGKGKMIGVSVIIRDATVRRRAEDAMKASLREKEVLLKEIHHRVKNNLQVVSSLLRLQSENVSDKKTASLFLDSQERVRAMAMVHEYLYKSPDLARIDFAAYVAGLVRNLDRTFGLTASGHPPTVGVDDVHLDLDVAVPCGLLLTELVSNAAKYAYPAGSGGEIEVGFRKSSGGRYELSVADHGVGFAPGFDWMGSPSLGLRIVRLLTEQLQGEVVMENGSGVRFVVSFNARADERAEMIGGR